MSAYPNEGNSLGGSHMSVCTFFGYSQSPPGLRHQLRSVLVDLIEAGGVRTFYVGNQNGFDHMVCSVLRELCREYSAVSYGIVPACLPMQRQGEWVTSEGDPHTLLPEGIETAAKGSAIAWRDLWMLEQADYVVTYVVHLWGGAAQLAHQAKKMGKRVVNLDIPDEAGAYIGRL